MVELLLKDEVYRVVGAAIEVHKHLGHGFLEPIYQEALELELTARALPFHAQQELHVQYKGATLKRTYVADFICFDCLIVEIKALKQLTSIEESQILNYMKVTGLKVGLLINFGASGKLEWKRLVL